MYLPNLDGGGAERVFVELANEFSKLGFGVDFALASARGPYLSELSSDVQVINFDTSGALGSLPKLSRYLASEKPDVLLSGLDHTNVVAIMARLASRSRTRCVISMRSVPTALYRESRSLSRWVQLQLMRMSYRFADAIIVNSGGVASDLSKFIWIPESRLDVIYNPVNLPWIEELSLQPFNQPWCLAETSPMILGVGRLDLLKDFPTLVHAFAVVRAKRECRLVILGEGPDRGKLEQLIWRLGLEHDAYLPGFVSNPFPWMRHAKVFVSSSLTEGCSNALMQALACGTPVVSTDCVGGSAEILQDGKWGRLFRVGDSKAMAEAIEATLEATNHPDVRQRVRDFAHDKIVQQYLDVLLPNYLPSVRPR